jgi:hypothetical protein
MKKKDELVGLGKAASLARVSRCTILAWEKKGWITAAIALAPRVNGRPGKLFLANQIKKVAEERGRYCDKSEVA